MPAGPNKIIQFWQELKRRKVFSVIAMYAAAAFIILEVVDIVLPRLGLPDWTVTMVIVLLAVGFPIAMILSWIFDITPKGIIKTEPVETVEAQTKSSEKSRRKFRISDGIIVVLFLVVCVLLYPKIFRPDKYRDIRDEDGRISVVVMPFKNLTGDSFYDIWQEGLQKLLITSLANSEELAVRQAETMTGMLRNRIGENYASFTPTIASEVAKKLEAYTVIIGHVHKAGGKVRITANILDARNEEVYKSYEVDGNAEEDFFEVTDSISLLIQHFLELESLQKNQFWDLTNVYTKSPEAYKLYVQGANCVSKLDYRCAIDCLTECLAIDSNFVAAMRSLAYAYGDIGQVERCKQWAYKACENLDRVPRDVQLTIKEVRAAVDKQPYDQINYVRQYVELYPNSMFKQYTLGWVYFNTGQWQNAISALENALEIATKHELTAWVWTYILLAQAYHETDNHEAEERVFEEGIRLWPGEKAQINYWQAMCAVSQGDSVKAGTYLDKLREIGKDNQWPESSILNWLAGVYTLADVPEKAEELHRQALAVDPDNPNLMNDLASFLISRDKDMDERMELMERVLEKEPENPDYLFTYGKALHQVGLLEESFRVLKESWDLRPYYDHEHFLLLAELEEALDNQNQ